MTGFVAPHKSFALVGGLLLILGFLTLRKKGPQEKTVHNSHLACPLFGYGSWRYCFLALFFVLQG
ncbi:MAG: hypothetical protein NUV70_04790 [Caldiserica bacterium]|nr:hypothetical protein [Caldisericota bacterium]